MNHSTISIHPNNPKLFRFLGQACALLTASEHYGAVMNRPFRFEHYLADAAAKHINYTRLFTLFRELQGPNNPYSTCKPESPDYVAPYRRVGPGRALDGEPVYDLDQPNPEFYERLHRFLSLASEYGIIVEVVLLSNTYGENIWALNPLHPRNNINGLEDIHWSEYMSQRHPRLFARQTAHVQRIVQETNRYDNILYEICNEPGGDFNHPGSPPVAEVNDWLKALISTVRQTEASLPNQHLIAGQEAFAYHPWQQMTTQAFHDFPVDVVNVHPLPNTTYAGQSYDQGAFMSKQLHLRPLRDYCLATYAVPRPLIMDEDNIASQYKDLEGWTIHRKRAWTTLMCGTHYDMIDFSIINYCETGTPASQQAIRAWMKHLADFIASLDLVRARPQPEIVRATPEHILACVLAVPGEEYAIYLAEARELDETRTPGVSENHWGLELALPDGAYRMACYAPETGLYSPWITLEGGRQTAIHIPVFAHDIALRIVKI